MCNQLCFRASKFSAQTPVVVLDLGCKLFLVRKEPWPIFKIQVLLMRNLEVFSLAHKRICLMEV